MARAKAFLTAANQLTGLPISGATIAFYEDDQSTTFAASLYTANTGGSSTTTHQTNGAGELTRYTPIGQRAYYSINGSAVRWPITFEVESQDVLALADDGVTMTKAYAALARVRIAAVEGVIRDMGAERHHIDAYAAALGTPVNDGVGDPDNAIAAIIVALGGQPGVIQYGPGTYLAVSNAINWPSNVHLRGCGPGITTIKHRDNSSQPCFSLTITSTRTNIGLDGFTFDGNLSNNLGYDNSEVSIECNGPASGGGAHSLCFIRNCEFKNFNKTAAAIGGAKATMNNCHINGPATDPYTNILDTGPTPTRYGGLYGVICSGATVSTDVAILNTRIHGLRSAAIIPGGIRPFVHGCQLYDNHRGDFPNTAAQPLTPGSQIAPGYTLTAASATQPPTDVVIDSCQIGPVAVNGTIGTYNTGMEFNGVVGLIVNNCTINDQYHSGIAIQSTQSATSNVLISNSVFNSINSVNALVSAAPSGSVAVFASGTLAIRGLRLSNLTVTGCRNLLYTGGDIAGISLSGIFQNGNTAGWEQADSSTDWTSGGHTYAAGGLSAVPLPNRSYQNYGTGTSTIDAAWGQVIISAHASGHGLRVAGGADGSHYALRLDTNAGVFHTGIYGNGSMQFAASAVRLIADLSNATVANRFLFQDGTTNNNSIVGVIPNGSGTTAGFAAYNSSNTAATSILVAQVTASAAQINSTQSGGTSMPLQLQYGGTTRIEMNTTGIGVFAATPVARPTITGVRTGTLGQLQTVVANMLTALGAASGVGWWTDSTT